MTVDQRREVFVRRYLGDAVADRLQDLPYDEIPSVLARAELSRSYLQEDLRKAARR